MHRHFRSPFESMVFANTNAQGSTPGPAVGNSFCFSRWVQDFRPSRPTNKEDLVVSKKPVDKAHIAPSTVEPSRNRYSRFDPTYLFEVVVMYLLNGLSASGQTTKGTDLLHYLLYIVPEADKLHVVDLDAHSGYFERVQTVRVIFDHIDYRFRVIVQRGGEQGKLGWVDICPFLRKRFDSVVDQVMPRVVTTDSDHPGRKGPDISDFWVELVTEFRGDLLYELHIHSGLDPMSMNDWVLKPDEICWEEPTYGAGGVDHRSILVDKRMDKEDKLPFIMSYWADNYLEFDTYKTAKVFNGMVGYGQYLVYRNDNHYSGPKSKGNNNFFV